MEHITILSTTMYNRNRIHLSYWELLE